MSDVVRLKIKGKSLKAKIAGDDQSLMGEENSFGEDNFKNELENQYKLGFEEGANSAKLETEKYFNEQLDLKQKEFYNILAQFDEQMSEMEKSFGHIVIQVAKKIAKKIVKKELELNSKINETLQESLKKVIGANEVFIKLNPKDYSEIITESSEYKKFSKISFEQDDSIQIGGCLVETDIGNVDARIATQINQIEKAVELSLEENDKETSL